MGTWEVFRSRSREKITEVWSLTKACECECVCVCGEEWKTPNNSYFAIFGCHSGLWSGYFGPFLS